MSGDVIDLPVDPEPTSLDLENLVINDVPEDISFGTPNPDAAADKKKPRAFWRDADKTPSPPRVRKPVPRAKKGQFIEPLQTLYVTLGMTLYGFDQVCGMAIINSAEACAKTLDDLAYQNDAVRRVLLSLTTTSAAGAVLMAHLPILIAVASHHVPAAAAYLPNPALFNPAANPVPDDDSAVA